MTDYRDELGAWVRPMEQRFRALVEGAISIDEFLNLDIIVSRDEGDRVSLFIIEPAARELLGDGWLEL